MSTPPCTIDLTSRVKRPLTAVAVVALSAMIALGACSCSSRPDTPSSASSPATSSSSSSSAQSSTSASASSSQHSAASGATSEELYQQYLEEQQSRNGSSSSSSASSSSSTSSSSTSTASSNSSKPNISSSDIGKISSSLPSSGSTGSNNTSSNTTSNSNANKPAVVEWGESTPCSTASDWSSFSVENDVLRNYGSSGRQLTADVYITSPNIAYEDVWVEIVYYDSRGSWCGGGAADVKPSSSDGLITASHPGTIDFKQSIVSDNVETYKIFVSSGSYCKAK